MTSENKTQGEGSSSGEIFSYHLVPLSALKVLQQLSSPLYKKNIPGLKHSENFFTMNLGQSTLAASRYNFGTLAVFAWWSEERFLDAFLSESSNGLDKGWHVRMQLYRRWGGVAAIDGAVIRPELRSLENPVIAVTLARLKLSQTLRFERWGRPVESQVLGHQGKTLSIVAMRPMNTFSTFSIWKNESEMLNMVHGKTPDLDGESHAVAMKERAREAFHYEFATMRFSPLKEMGSWKGKADYIPQL